ncbi:macrophage mannose receptor 1-like isoform X2 [Colossoma macropomum]|uniref:macrophage mannose receptor 1-like isoform X2 n=1 Tax=Colossoma macropomum TaxID=42526 RepID=UPI001863BAA6|nr:macrophage mannose receptor 1-like isoform X2 [Colossoma macropomum]
MDQKWTSLVLLFTVVCVASYLPHRYHFVNQYKNWTEAQRYCRQTYTDLATINNLEEMNTVKAMLQNQVGCVWIGLNRVDGQKWLWSLEDGTSFINGQSYTNWLPGEPNNGLKSNSCVFMRGFDGLWTDDECTNKYYFVCYTGKKTAITKLVLVTQQKTFPDAQIYCRKQYADLPSVRNDSENQNIHQVANGTPVWFGMFRESWGWSDQSNSIYRNWWAGQPDDTLSNEDCVAVVASGQQMGSWEDRPCQTTLPFICHENKLILINQNLTWREALRYCRDNHVDLVSVHSEEIQLWVMMVAQKASTEHVWLGLRHTCTPGFWYWLNVSPICYENWAPGNGTGGEDCSSVERTGAVQSRGGQQWVSLPETQKLNFICIAYED